MPSKKNGVETTQLTGNDAYTLGRYSRTLVRNGIATQNARALADDLESMATFLEGVDFWNDVYDELIPSDILDFAEFIINLLQSYNNLEISTIEELLLQGHDGMEELATTIANHPTWQMAEVTYDVLYLGSGGSVTSSTYEIKAPTAANTRINRVKINIIIVCTQKIHRLYYQKQPRITFLL